MRLITEKEYREFVKKRNEINELILVKTVQLSYILYNRCPEGECCNYDFEEEDGKLVVQFESYKCQETDYDTFYLPLEFLFYEYYPEEYKLIHEEEKKKKEEDRIRKKNEEKEKRRLDTEKFEREEYERLKAKFEKLPK